MDVPGSSSCIATLQESVPSDEDPFQSSCCGQWTIEQMNLPDLVLVSSLLLGAPSDLRQCDFFGVGLCPVADEFMARYLCFSLRFIF